MSVPNKARDRFPPAAEFWRCDLVEETKYDKIFPDGYNIRVEDDAFDLTGGGGSFQYPNHGKNHEFLDIKTEIALLRNGSEKRNSRFIIDDWADDVVEEGDDSLRSVTYRLRPYLHRLKDAFVMPRLTDDLAVPYTHEGELAGAIFREHWLRAKGDYGALPGFNTTATNLLTSSGASWGEVVPKLDIEVGVPLLALLGPDYLGNYMTAFTRRRTLHLELPEFGTDWTEDQGVGGKNVKLIRGFDLLDGPRQRYGNQVCTHVLVVGDGGRKVQVDADEDRIERFGHIWKYLPASGFTDYGTLERLGELWLAENQSARDSVTYSVAQGLGNDAYETYDNNDWVYILDDQDSQPQPYRIRRIVTETDLDGQMSVNLVANDWMDEHEVQLQKKLDGITNDGDGAKGGRVINPDKIAPASPNAGAAPTLTTFMYEPPPDVGGGNRAYVTAGTVAPTTDADGAPLYDLSHYEFEWRYTTRPGWIRQRDNDVSADIRNLDPGRSVNVRVIAVDVHGNESEPTAAATITTATDHGGFRTYDDVTGEVIWDLRNGERAHAPVRFTIGNVPGSFLAPGGFASTDFAPTAAGPGIRLQETGFETWATDGHRSVFIDGTTGDVDINGNLTVAGESHFYDDTYVHDDFHVDATSTFTGDVTIGSLIIFDASSGSLTLGALKLNGDIDADGHTISGAKFITEADGMTLDHSTLSFAGGGSIAFDDDQMTFSGSSAYKFFGAVLAEGYIGDVFQMSTPPVVSGLMTTLASVITKVNALGNAVESCGLINYS